MQKTDPMTQDEKERTCLFSGETIEPGQGWSIADEERYQAWTPKPAPQTGANHPIPVVGSRS